VFLLAGDTESYTRLCRDHFDHTQTVRLLAPTSLLLRHDLLPPDLARQARQAAEESADAPREASTQQAEPPDYWGLLERGDLLHRLGRFEEAFAALQIAGQSTNPSCALRARATAVLTAFQLGRRDEARVLLLQVGPEFQHMLEINQSRLEPDWQNPAFAELNLTEARQLLGPEDR
jgi:tetratricopeptide (TPR) repeat protein